MDGKCLCKGNSCNQHNLTMMMVLIMMILLIRLSGKTLTDDHIGVKLTVTKCR